VQVAVRGKGMFKKKLKALGGGGGGGGVLISIGAPAK